MTFCLEVNFRHCTFVSSYHLMNSITPIKRLSLADEVAQRLQQQISLGQYKPGDKLPIEPALMQEFGVGRSTIREAVRILANAGVLRVQQGLGTFVEAPSDTEPLSQRMKRADFKDLNEIRALLEQKIAEKAALHRTEADIEKMRQCLALRAEMAAANKVEECIKADIAFHSAIAAAAQNGFMADLYSTVARHLLQYFVEVHKSTKVFIESQEWHQQLLEAIIHKQPAEAWAWISRIASFSLDVDQRS